MSPPPFLPHALLDCPGRWKAIGPQEHYIWRCTHCGREHLSTPENDHRAVYENALGVLMKVMAINASLPPEPELEERTEFIIDIGRMIEEASESDDSLDIGDPGPSY